MAIRKKKIKKKSKQRRSRIKKKSKQRRSRIKKKSKQRRSRIKKKSKQRRSRIKKKKKSKKRRSNLISRVSFIENVNTCTNNGGIDIRSQGLKVFPSELVSKPVHFITNPDKTIKSIDDNKLHKVCTRAEIRHGIDSDQCKKICPDPNHFLAYNMDKDDYNKWCCYTEDKKNHPHVTDIIKNFNVSSKIKKKHQTNDTKKIHIYFNNMEDDGTFISYDSEDLERFKTNYKNNQYTLDTLRSSKKKINKIDIQSFIHTQIKLLTEERKIREQAQKIRQETPSVEPDDDLFAIAVGDGEW